MKKTYLKRYDARFDMVLPSGLLDEVKAVAEAAEVSAGQWVRQAIREKLERDNAE